MEQSEILSSRKLKNKKTSRTKKNADIKHRENIYFHALSKEDCLKKLNSDKNTGLSVSEVQKRKERFGLNILKEEKPKNILTRFFQQFTDFMIIILLFAAAISFVTAIIEGESRDFLDPVIILVIVIINAVTGVVQEYKAEKAIYALKKLTTPEAFVMRNGKREKILSENLVPGDIIFLEAGDSIPADARIIDGYSVEADESSLTGESTPVEKDGSEFFTQSTALGDRKNMLYMSSVMTAGKCSAVVTDTGMTTEVGKIAEILTQQEEVSTPLQEKLSKTGQILGITALSVCAVIFLLGIINNTPFLEMFMLSISLAVAAMPEGLPAIVTIVLAIGVQRMAKSRAIIRRLSAVETLGNATVICSDKTGTLTQNKMTVVSIYGSTGKTLETVESTTKTKYNIDATLKNILLSAVLCNNAVAENSIKSKNDTQTINNNYIGDPTETALCVAGEKFGIIKSDEENKYQRIYEIPFNSTRKLMTTVNQIFNNNQMRVITKGAPDMLIAKCTHYIKTIKYMGNSENSKIETEVMTSYKRAEFLEYNEKMAKRALRVIAVAYKDIPAMKNFKSSTSDMTRFLENNLVFCGLLGMIDPPRPEVPEAVRICKTAGIKPVMITGDHKITAMAIAEQIGIYDKNDINSRVATGAELDAMSEEKLAEDIYFYSVFARVSPEHKVRIVKSFKERGNIAAMTGDGVNDAPSLKIADIGCAMGKNGTDVARNSADMILVDDNFSTIVEAIRQGRGIYDNIKKAVHFLLSSNFGEIMTIFTAFFLKLPTPLIAIHLLWVNFVTDSLPALALSAEKPDTNIMRRPPANPRKSLFADGLGLKIVFEGFMIGSLTLLAFVIGYKYFDYMSSPIIGRTMAFSTLSLSQLVHAYNMRSAKSVFKIGVFSNTRMNWAFITCAFLQITVVAVKPLSDIFKTTNLSLYQWGIVVLLSITPLVIVELQKLVTNYEK